MEKMHNIYRYYRACPPHIIKNSGRADPPTVFRKLYRFQLKLKIVSVAATAAVVAASAAVVVAVIAAAAAAVVGKCVVATASTTGEEKNKDDYPAAVVVTKHIGCLLVYIVLKRFILQYM